MRFIDTNILVDAFHNNENQMKCQKIIYEGGTINTVNLIETFNVLENITNRDVAQEAIEVLFKSDLDIIDVDINLIFESMKRSNKYKKLKFIDLVHYITALMNECQEFMSYDKDFDNLEIQRTIP